MKTNKYFEIRIFRPLPGEDDKAGSFAALYRLDEILPLGPIPSSVARLSFEGARDTERFNGCMIQLVKVEEKVVQRYIV